MDYITAENKNLITSLGKTMRDTGTQPQLKILDNLVEKLGKTKIIIGKYSKLMSEYNFKNNKKLEDRITNYNNLVKNYKNNMISGEPWLFEDDIEKFYRDEQSLNFFESLIGKTHIPVCCHKYRGWICQCTKSTTEIKKIILENKFSEDVEFIEFLSDYNLNLKDFLHFTVEEKWKIYHKYEMNKYEITPGDIRKNIFDMCLTVYNIIIDHNSSKKSVEEIYDLIQYHIHVCNIDNKYFNNIYKSFSKSVRNYVYKYNL